MSAAPQEWTPTPPRTWRRSMTGAIPWRRYCPGPGMRSRKQCMTTCPGAAYWAGTAGRSPDGPAERADPDGPPVPGHLHLRAVRTSPGRGRHRLPELLHLPALRPEVPEGIPGTQEGQESREGFEILAATERLDGTITRLECWTRTAGTEHGELKSQDKSPPVQFHSPPETRRDSSTGPGRPGCGSAAARAGERKQEVPR